MSNRKSAARQSSDVRFSDRGYAFSETGTGRTGGIVGFFSDSEKPILNSLSKGILIYNTTYSRLELSDPDNNQWIVYSGVSISGNEISIGLPIDGSFSDGAVNINASASVADAIDAINEYLVTHASTYSGATVTSGTTTNQTLRWNGSSYVPTSSVISDGTNFSVSGNLSCSGTFQTASGVAPTNSGSAGSNGEFRWDNSFLYFHTASGWTRVPLNYF